MYLGFGIVSLCFQTWNAKTVVTVCSEDNLKVYPLPGHSDGVMALFGQRFGCSAPYDQGCQDCYAGHNAFETCRVAIDKDPIHRPYALAIIRRPSLS
ncbi:hypothetical protein N7475_003550 [Penicillium sp. IBT 31633x]|nr:hypothetical protein N7475_003550 [Penicillium sp. IBT 31633x]